MCWWLELPKKRTINFILKKQEEFFLPNKSLKYLNFTTSSSKHLNFPALRDSTWNTKKNPAIHQIRISLYLIIHKNVADHQVLLFPPSSLPKDPNRKRYEGSLGLDPERIGFSSSLSSELGLLSSFSSLLILKSQASLHELEIGGDPHGDDHLVTRRVRILLKLIIMSVMNAI